MRRRFVNAAAMRDGEGSPTTPPVTNRILATLHPADQALLRPYLSRVTLEAGQVLTEPDAPIDHIWFPEAGTMVMLFVAMRDGRIAQAATVANYGSIGLIEAAADGVAPTRATVVIPGTAMRMRMADARSALRRSVRLRGMLSHYAEAMLAQAMQLAACNALHSVERRAARWILTAHDCVLRNHAADPGRLLSLPMKQEMLGEVLGVQRTTITLAARKLQDAGTISYMRGRIAVTDRPALERASCECHERLWTLWRRLLSDVVDPPWRAEGSVIAPIDAPDQGG